jgi:hypothetical protein
MWQQKYSTSNAAIAIDCQPCIEAMVIFFTSLRGYRNKYLPGSFVERRERPAQLWGTR